jgi:hypothetical protein
MADLPSLKNLVYIGGAMKYALQSLLALRLKQDRRAWHTGSLTIVFLLLFLQPIRSQVIMDFIITADNAYAVGFGDYWTIHYLPNPNGVDNCTAGEIYNCSGGPETYTSIPVGFDDYIYICAWSDEAVWQGVIAEFTDGATTIQTQPNLPTPWEVFATGSDIDPSCPSGSSAPSLPAINYQIYLANTSNGGVNSSVTWVDENSAGSNGRLEFDPYMNGVPPTLFNPFPPNDVCGMGPAQWMWYNPDPGVITDPFVGGGYMGEFLIFRLKLSDNFPQTFNWIKKDFEMKCGPGATCICVYLAGDVLPIYWHYDGWPSPKPDWGVFNSFQASLVGGSTLLKWCDFEDGDNDVIDPGQVVHIGWSANGPNNVECANWCMPKAGSKLFACPIKQVGAYGMMNGELWERVVWNNMVASDGIPESTLTITDVQFAAFATPVSPDSLNCWNSELDSALQPMPGGDTVTLPYNQFVTLPFPAPIDSSEWVVVKYTVDSSGSEALVTDYVLMRPLSHCCGIYTGGQTGNTNCDTEGKRNLADITQLISRVYLTPEVPLCCEENGNTNGDPAGTLNLADITKLIDYVYISHAETAPCQ